MIVLKLKLLPCLSTIVIEIGIKNINHHLARIVILIIFTSIFYNDYLYTIFAVLVGILATYGTQKYLKKGNAYLSVFLGIICSIISHVISIPLNIQNY